MKEEIKEIQQEEEAPTVSTVNCGMTLYDLNKQLVEQLSALTDTVIKKKKKEIKKFVSIDHADSSYYMLLCRDINYYTLFHLTDAEVHLEDEMIECLRELGTIVSIEVLENNSIECWIKNTDGTFMLMFFPYDLGVIECQ